LDLQEWEDTHSSAAIEKLCPLTSTSKELLKLWGWVKDHKRGTSALMRKAEETNKNRSDINSETSSVSPCKRKAQKSLIFPGKMSVSK
jgi:hypothetical protein